LLFHRHISLSLVLLSASLLETFALDYLHLSIPSSSSFLRIVCCTFVIIVVLNTNFLYPFVFPFQFFLEFSYSLGLQLVATSPCTKPRLFLECVGFVVGFEEFCVEFGRNPSKWGLLRSEECGGGGWRRLLACLLACSLSVCMAEEEKGTATKKKNNRGAVLSLMEYWV
jgi:hypothetical protein